MLSSFYINIILIAYFNIQITVRLQVFSYFVIPVFRRSTRKFPAFLFFSFFVSSSVPRFFLYLQQIFNALSGLFLLEKFF